MASRTGFSNWARLAPWILQANGNSVSDRAQIMKDTVKVGPGERYEMLSEAREPGKWLLRCHRRKRRWLPAQDELSRARGTVFASMLREEV